MEVECGWAVGADGFALSRSGVWGARPGGRGDGDGRHALTFHVFTFHVTQNSSYSTTVTAIHFFPHWRAASWLEKKRSMWLPLMAAPRSMTSTGCPPA